MVAEDAASAVLVTRDTVLVGRIWTLWMSVLVVVVFGSSVGCSYCSFVASVSMSIRFVRL